MGESISNFIELLTKGDFFLIFLIAMMVIIIGVIVYLVRLQINDAPYYEKKDYDDEEEQEDDFEDDLLIDEELKDDLYDEKVKPLKEEPVINYERIPDTSSLEEDTNVLDNDVDNMISEGISISEDVEDIVNEPSITYRDEDFESPAHPKPRFIEQSRFDFDEKEEEEEPNIDEVYDKTDTILSSDTEPTSSSVNVRDNRETMEMVKNYEDEQENTAIISASELDSRINELKANGEYEEHERQLEEYEKEQENKAIISYEELLERASHGTISYESEEELGGGIRVGKVDTSNIETYSETSEKPYYKEEAFLEAMKEFRRAL